MVVSPCFSPRFTSFSRLEGYLIHRIFAATLPKVGKHGSAKSTEADPSRGSTKGIVWRFEKYGWNGFDMKRLGVGKRGGRDRKSVV